MLFEQRLHFVADRGRGGGVFQTWMNTEWFACNRDAQTVQAGSQIDEISDDRHESGIVRDRSPQTAVLRRHFSRSKPENQMYGEVLHLERTIRIGLQGLDDRMDA